MIFINKETQRKVSVPYNYVFSNTFLLQVTVFDEKDGHSKQDKQSNPKAYLDNRCKSILPVTKEEETLSTDKVKLVYQILILMISDG